MLSFLQYLGKLGTGSRDRNGHKVGSIYKMLFDNVFVLSKNINKCIPVPLKAINEKLVACQHRLYMTVISFHLNK